MVRLRRSLIPLTLSAALALAISACGSSSSSSSGTGTASAAASTSSPSARYQARLSLAKCLRAHGLNVPDPSPSGGVPGGGGGGGVFRSLRDQPNFQSALQACAKYRRGAFGLGNLSPAQQAQLRQDLVKFAECMRSHNIDIPDPSTSAGGGFGIFRQIPSSERDSPEFRSALQACVSNLPFRRGSGGGGGPVVQANPGA